MKKLDIRYEDKDLIVVSKPAKMLTISDNSSRPSLYEAVSDYVKKQHKNNKIFIVHRLDKDTAGLIVFAKSMRVKTLLQKNWDQVSRKYYAVVEDQIKPQQKTLINYLKESKTFQVYVSKEGQKAITEYTVIKSNTKYSLIDINIKTGRKNQIRVQLSHYGYPVVGDKKYGSLSKTLNRLALVAYNLSFCHPITGELITLTTPVPKDFLALVEEEKK